MPGDKLLSERKLSAQMKISSRTLGIAMRKLVAENLIIRNKFGTFVCPIGHENTTDSKNIYVLLPSSDFHFSGNRCSQSTHQQMIDVARHIACTNGGNVVTIPVSDHNDINDMDKFHFENLPYNSNVLFSSLWFEKVFPILVQKKCRIGALNAPPGVKEIFEENDFFMVYYGMAIKNSYYDVISYFKEKKCRKILTVVYEKNMMYYDYKDEFQKILELNKMGGDLIPFKKNDSMEQLCNLWQQDDYDALFFAPEDGFFKNLTGDFYESIRISPDVPVLLYTDEIYNQPRLAKHAKYMYLPTAKYIKKIAEFLISNEHGQIYKVAENEISDFI